jgi:cyanate permease
LIIMGYSIGQWLAPWMAGRIFDAYHSYSLAWTILSIASLLGAAAIYSISVPSATGPVGAGIQYSSRSPQD